MTDPCCSQASARTETGEISALPVQSNSNLEILCPECFQKGTAVQGQTVKSLLSASLRLVPDSNYYFCRTQSCPVVYYALDGKSIFKTSELRVKVYQKEPDTADVFVCYCFNHTVADIRGAAAETRVSIVKDINLGIQANQCACDLRNPQGSCCLGNVRRLIKQTEINSVK